MNGQIRLWASDRAIEIPQSWDKRFDKSMGLSMFDKGSPLVGYWHVNEGVYHYVYDYSGGAHHSDLGSLHYIMTGSQVR